MKGDKTYAKAIKILDDLYQRKDLNLVQKKRLYKSYVGLIRNAAYLGNGNAQFELGQVYEDINFFGINRNQDPEKCVYWYSKACANNHAEACNSLANLYETGKGVSKNVSKARSLYRKAAKLGNSLAKDNLSLFK